MKDDEAHVKINKNFQRKNVNIFLPISFNIHSVAISEFSNQLTRN